MRVLALALCTLGFSAPAQAQWMSRTIEDPFGKDNIVGAITAAEGKGLIVRCIGGTKLNIRFMPNERGSDEMERFLNAVGPKIFVRIDNAPVQELEATVQNDDKNRFIADADIDLAMPREWLPQRRGLP